MRQADMLDVKELLKEYSAVEKEFFEIDEEKGIAHVKLHFKARLTCLRKTVCQKHRASMRTAMTGSSGSSP